MFFRAVVLCVLAQISFAAWSGEAEPAPAGSQPLTIQLPEVVVQERAEPTLAPPPPAPARRPLTVPNAQQAADVLDRVPGGVDIIKAEEFKSGRASTVPDALAFSPGVYAQSRFGSEEARLSIRGSGIQRTFHGRGLRLMQDGVPLNLGDGSFDFQAVEPLAVDYIEILRGANALHYGSQTLGGAINYVSPTGHTASKAQVRVEAGSFDYLKAQLSSGMVLGPVDYYLSLTHFSQEGFRDHARQGNQRVFGNVGWRAEENLETRFYLTWVKSDSELPGNLFKAEIDSDPDAANPVNITGDQKRDFELLRAANKTTYQIADDERITFGSYWSYKDLDHPIFQVIDDVSNDFGLDIRYTNDRELFCRKNFLAIGFNPTYGFVNDNRFVNAGGSPGERTGKNFQESQNYDFYAENQHYILDNLALIGGMQLSYSVRQSEDNFPASAADPDNSDRQDWFGASPKIGARWEFMDEAQVFFNFSRSFEPPSFGELVGQRSGGLTQLDAQRASTVELGTRGEYWRLGWDVAFYHARLEDELLSLTDETGAPLGTVNARKTIHQGVEAGLDFTLWEGVAERCGEKSDRILLRQVYAWNDFRFDDDPLLGDNQLAGIPEHHYRGELLYEHPVGFYAGVNVEWVPRRFFVDHANTFSADQYSVLNFKTGAHLPNGLSVFFDARNLSDREYAATVGVINNANAGDARQFSPGDGRSFYVGVEWKW